MYKPKQLHDHTTWSIREKNTLNGNYAFSQSRRPIVDQPQILLLYAQDFA